MWVWGEGYAHVSAGAPESRRRLWISDLELHMVVSA